MPTAYRLTFAAAVAASVFAPGVGSAAASTFGQELAMCAHELGQRTDAPAITCSHDGMTMTFANFGAMVKHMRQMA